MDRMKERKERERKGKTAVTKSNAGVTKSNAGVRKANVAVRKKAQSGVTEKAPSGVKEKAPSGVTEKDPTGVKETGIENKSFYDRIMRLGYGPPEGIKLDRAGWRKYFDEMHERKHFHLTRRVFADVLPEKWRPIEKLIRVEWLDGVDKEVTARSNAFMCFPRYQYIWQNGYAPQDGDKWEIEDWEKFEAEMTEDELEKMNKDLFVIPHDPVHDELWKVYVKQIRDSEGFDVDVRIHRDGTIVPMFDDMSQAKSDDSLIQYSANALVAYNEREGTDYAVNQVVKACTQEVVGKMYYITFEASNSEGDIVFQAKVHQRPNESEEIVLVRPKPIVASFYRRIMRLGYGPPNGDKLTKAEWRAYFDGIHCLKLHRLILHVFGDELPKEWRVEEIRAEWLEGIDKDVTSRSNAFVRCPLYQYIWQNGYGPKDKEGDKLDFEGWRKFMAEMSKDERENMSKNLFDKTHDPVRDAQICEMYQKQIKKSEGFDVDIDLHVRGGCGTILPMFYDMSEAKYDDKLIDYSNKALDIYNKRGGTKYVVHEVVKANTQGVVGPTYYITFLAKNSEGDIQEIQAKVCKPKGSEEKILIVRRTRKRRKA